MPTRKQRRRQAKAKRHEYEYVYVDEEGNEVEVAEDDVKAERTASRNGRAKPNPRAARGARVQPPSWSRVAKRGLIFAPLMFITVYPHEQRRDAAPASAHRALADGDLPAVQLLHGLVHVQALPEAHRRSSAPEALARTAVVPGARPGSQHEQQPRP